jgi:acyl-coenzyme A synthetase/AMP-(fatty) acid ligase
MSLLSRFPSYSAKPALAGAWGVVTFGELGALVGKAQQSLAQLKLDHPTAFGLIGEHGPASTAWLIALAEAGHFVAPLSGNAAEHPAKLALINAQWIITTGKVTWHVLPREYQRSTHPLFAQLREHGSASLVLFSSGTSGTPKAMVQDFTTLLATYESRHPSRLPLLALLGFDHIGGINTLLEALASGAMLVVPENRSAQSVAMAMAEYRVGVLPASPTFLNLLLASGELQSRDLSSLKIITYGTEPMPEALLRRLRQAFPHVRFIQTFGTSETGIARTESPEPGSTFFRFSDHDLKWKVIDDELWLKSRTQIVGYLNSTNEAFMADGWFRTGDKVESGPDGTLRISGRVGETINVCGEKLMPQEVEAVILDIDGVTECRAFGESHALTGQTVAVDIVAAGNPDFEGLRAKIRTVYRAKLARHKVPTRVNFVSRVSGERLKKIRIKKQTTGKPTI